MTWTAVNISVVVIYTFKGEECLPGYGLDLDLGENVKVLQQCGDWYYGRTAKKVGVFPKSYTAILKEETNSTVFELKKVIEEWMWNYKKLYTINTSYQFEVIGRAIRELIEGRKQLINGTLTQDQFRELESKLLDKVDWGNRRLGLDLVSRGEDGTKLIGGVSPVVLYSSHLKSVENGEALRGTIRKKKQLQKAQHLHLNVKDINVQDDCEVFFSIYDPGPGACRFVTDRWKMSQTALGQSTFIQPEKQIIFKDYNPDHYLVITVNRTGRMFSTDTNKKYNPNYRRPLACGVLQLAEIDEMEKDFNLKMVQVDEKDFYQIHEIIIRKISKVASAPGVSVTVCAKVVTEFSGLNVIGGVGMQIFMPGVVRNDLYVTLVSAELEKGGKPTGKNIEAQLAVYDSGGVQVKSVICGSLSGDGDLTDDYRSLILYHHNCPKWNETLRLSVPIEVFIDCHLRILLFHCSTKEKNEKKLFAMAYMKLMDAEGTTIKDKIHELPIYKVEEKGKINLDNLQKSSKEHLFIETFLVSTKLTQNVDLVQLLKWKTSDNLRQTLQNIQKLPGEELVKFLQDVLDVLFAMFSGEDGNPTEYSADVFSVLVYIFTTLEISKFSHFKNVIHAYIREHFAAALVYKGLISSVCHYSDVLPKASDPEILKQIQACFQSLEFIFKFIVQSQILFARATGNQLEDSFRRDIQSLFKSFHSVLSNEELTEQQITLLLTVDKMYEELLRVLSINDVTLLVNEFFAAIPLKESVHPLSPHKLTALHKLVKSELFKAYGPRSTLLSEVCRHLRHHLSHREELKLTTDVLGDILVILYDTDDPCRHNDIETVCTSTLEMLVQSVLVLERTSPIVGNLVTCLISLSDLMDDNHYNRLWDEFRERKPLRDFLLRIFLLFKDLIKQDVFPKDWSYMKLLTDSIMLRAMQQLIIPMSLYFLNKCFFDRQLWTEYFNLTVAFITQPGLQLESFRKNKKMEILSVYGDMRLRMGKLIVDLWANLGENKLAICRGMIGGLMEVALIPQESLRADTIPIFYDMMYCQWIVHGSFADLESHMIDNLDLLVSENKGDSEFKRLFQSILRKIVESYNDENWKNSALKWIDNVTKLLERLLDYRSVNVGDDNRDKRMACIVNLLHFYEDTHQAIYERYIDKLHDLHVSAENYTEAGYTLLLHKDIDNYVKVIDYFDKGKLWEKGIPLCKQLSELYENTTFDYMKLSDMLKTEAKFFEFIMNELRPEPEYFRVYFFGELFPSFVKNKEFVYRGQEYERLANFMQRLMAEWPNAKLFTHNNPPDSNLISAQMQYIQVSSVRPIQDKELSEKMPEKIKTFYYVNDVDTFIFDRRINKLDSENEFKNMWVERTKLKISSRLPGILRFFLVTKKDVKVLTPVEYACEKMADVNRKLKDEINSYLTDCSKNVNPLSMKLQGMLDASVMGGIPKYKDAFFNSEFLQESPDAGVFVGRLYHLILEQLTILEQGLTIHGRLVPAGVQPLHKRLLECFQLMKNTFDSEFGSFSVKRDGIGRESFRKANSIVFTPLPPLPKELDISDDEEVYSKPVDSSYSKPLDLSYSKPLDKSHNKSVDTSYGKTMDISLNNKPLDPSTPPPIPDRTKKQMIPSEGDYVVPPSRDREKTVTPPLLPKRPPPVPPKPKDPHKEFYVLPKNG